MTQNAGATQKRWSHILPNLWKVSTKICLLCLEMSCFSCHRSASVTLQRQTHLRASLFVCLLCQMLSVRMSVWCPYVLYDSVLRGGFCLTKQCTTRLRCKVFSAHY